MSGFFYHTYSQLTGQPIVVACVVPKDVTNPKTGGMAQIYILPDVGPDTTAHQAWNTGEYRAVCGACKHQTHNSCYVKRFRGSGAVLSAVYRGISYQEVTPDEFARRLEPFEDVRFGSDGDPAAVPRDDLMLMFSHAAARTGYTHQWRLPQFQFLKAFIMASVDTPDEYHQARSAGWRTFRTRLPDEPLLDGEYICPASAEGGKRMTCDTCLTCDGANPDKPRQASPAIIAHAAPHKYATLRLALANM